MQRKYRLEIDKIMYEKNFTFRKLARLSGISTSTLVRIINNQVSPKFETLVKIANALEIKVQDLIKEEE